MLRKRGVALHRGPRTCGRRWDQDPANHMAFLLLACPLLCLASSGQILQGHAVELAAVQK